MGEAGGIVEDAIRALSYMLCEIIYDLVIWIYNIFTRLCNSRILDSDILEIIAERIGIILGIIMLFMVIFSTIQMVLEPDKLTDKEKGVGNIAKKVILVVVMLGVSNSAFRMLYGLQTTLINSNIIQKFLLPYEINENVDFGKVLSSNLFLAFYNFNTDGLKVDENNNLEPEAIEKLSDNDKKCYNVNYLLKEDLESNGDFSVGKDCVNIISTNRNVYAMNFNWLISPIIGVVVLYFIFSYCLSIGMRTIQLAFLEIISSMAIISYLSPKKDNMFQKWTKIYFSTYIDVFLRIAIINLVVFLIMTLFEHSGEWGFWTSVGDKQGNFSDTVILVLIVMALLMFAKKAPDLIKELFPSSASKLGLGITSPKKLFDSMAGANAIRKVGSTGIGAITGGIGNAGRALFAKDKDGNPLSWKDKLTGFAGGLIGGAWTGGKAGLGAKGLVQAFGVSNKAAIDQSRRLAEWRAAGGTSPWARLAAGFQKSIGIDIPADEYDREKFAIEEENALYSQLTASFKSVKERAKSKIADGDFDSNAHVIASKTAQNQAEILKAQAGNLKLADFKKLINRADYKTDKDYNDAVLADEAAAKAAMRAREDYLNSEITRLNAKAVKELDLAVADYYNEAINPSGSINDVVINNEILKTQDLIDANKTLDGFATANISDFGSFKRTDGYVSNAQTNNNIRLAQNKREGRAARADAKYSGKPGGGKP